MEITLAWIKGKRTTGLRKVISNKPTFVAPIINRISPYDADLKLEEDEWFCLDNFSNSDYAIDVIRKDEASLLASTMISREEFDKMKFFIHYIDTGIFMFQAILSSRTLKSKMFTYKREPEIVDNQLMIIIQDIPDAVYNRNENKLYFRDLAKISHIFSGIGGLYREATDEEVRVFLQADFLKVNEGFDYSKVSVPNRKNIARFGAVYQGLDNDKKTKFKQYLQHYKADFRIEENEGVDKFVINSDEDLRALLAASAQRYFTTPFTEEPMLARSFQKVL